MLIIIIKLKINLNHHFHHNPDNNNNQIQKYSSMHIMSQLFKVYIYLILSPFAGSQNLHAEFN